MKTSKFRAVHTTRMPNGSPIVVMVLKGPDGYEQRITLRPFQAGRLLSALQEAYSLISSTALNVRRSDGPPYDAATATGMYDHD